MAAAVLEEIAKPLKVFGEIQHKARKATEALVRKPFGFEKFDITNSEEGEKRHYI